MIRSVAKIAMHYLGVMILAAPIVVLSLFLGFDSADAVVFALLTVLIYQVLLLRDRI